MIIGEGNRSQDIEVNICKTKKLTNMRSSTADVMVTLQAPRKMELEDALEYIENDELVLLDYKTDRVSDEKTLTDRYRVQLELYKRALEAATMRKVKEIYIYSFCLGSVIRL